MMPTAFFRFALTVWWTQRLLWKQYTVCSRVHPSLDRLPPVSPHTKHTISDHLKRSHLQSTPAIHSLFLNVAVSGKNGQSILHCSKHFWKTHWLSFLDDSKFPIFLNRPIKQQHTSFFYTCFGDVCPGIQSQGGSFASMVCCLHTMNSSDSPLV